MPAGDLISDNYQFELRTLLMGDTTNYKIDRDRGGYEGLWDIVINMPVTDLAHADGAHVGDATEGPKVITLALVIDTGDQTTAMAALTALRTAWAKSSSDIPLYFQFPSTGKQFVNGRPGMPGGPSVRPDMSMSDFGVIPVLCTFFCPDPTIT